jgi:hypothetical protein
MNEKLRGSAGQVPGDKVRWQSGKEGLTCIYRHPLLLR